MKNILTKLNKIQTELKAPKGQYNTFGKYKYRNAEDILEALKPLLVKHGASLRITDSIEMVGDRYYVKATVHLSDTETAEELTVEALAREADSKKGMDSSQVTGATSSYARKYALNGLFAIDDTRDANTQDNSKEGQFNETHAKKIASINTTEQLKQYWEAHQSLGREFGLAVTARKKEILDIENATKDV